MPVSATVMQKDGILSNDSYVSVFRTQGWAPRSFLFRTFRSFPFKKDNVTFFSVLFSRFW